MLSRRNADAIVGDGDLDVVIVASGLHMRRNDDPSPRVGIDDGVLDQIANRDAELASVTQHPCPRNARHRESDPMPLRVHSAPLDGVSQHLINVDDLRVSERNVGLQSRQLDNLANQIGQPCGLDPHATRELANGLGVLSGILSRLSQQRDRPNRGFELVTDVCDEIPTGFLYPPSCGLVVGQDENQVLIQWRDTGGEVAGGNSSTSADLQVDRTNVTFAAHDADQLQQFGHADPAAPN